MDQSVTPADSVSAVDQPTSTDGGAPKADTAAWQTALATATDTAANPQTPQTTNTAGDAGAKQQQGMPVTDAERKAAAAGDAETYWKLRQAQGDPVAAAGLSSLHPTSGPIDYLFGGSSINNRLEAFSRVYTGHSADINAIRQDLMKAHTEAVDADKDGVIGLLSPGQIYDYHVKVFKGYGLPETTFGGSPLTGARWEAYATRGIWCGGCDR